MGCSLLCLVPEPFVSALLIDLLASALTVSSGTATGCVIELSNESVMTRSATFVACFSPSRPAPDQLQPLETRAKRTMASVSAAHQQVLDFLAEGDFYSAHQKARTTATRLLAPPRRNAPPAGTALPYDAKAREAADLLWDAARKLLEKGQAGSGVDLATMLTQDVWTARGVACGKDERGTQPAGAGRRLRSEGARRGGGGPTSQ